MVIILTINTLILYIPFSANGAINESEALSANAIKTREEAVVWLNSQGGATYNLDTSTSGTQCVEFVKAYVNWLINGNPWADAWGRPTLNGGDIWQNSLWPELGWQVIQNSPDFIPQPGDIFSSVGMNDNGHTGVVISSDVNNAVVAEANVDDYSGSGTPVRVRNISWTGIHTPKYFIRPIFSTNGGGGAVDLGTDFYAFIFNTDKWKPLTVEQDLNVTIRSEKSYMCADQIFKFEKQSDQSYKIISTANGMCLDVKDASSASLANVKICESNNTDAQRWYIYGSSGQYTLKAKCTNCVLDVKDNGSADGTNIQMCTSNNSEAQKFQIYKEPTRPFAANLGDDFTVPILNKRSWITLENNNSNIILNKEVGKSKQLWKFIRQTDGSYKIYSCLDGKCVDLENACHEKGTNIGLCEENKGNAQRWYIYYLNDEYYFQSKESGMMFDITDNNLNYGSNLQACNWNGCDAQIFAIYWGKECKLSSPELEVIVNNSNGKVLLNWTEVYGETGYRVTIKKNQPDVDLYKMIETEETEMNIFLPAGSYQAYIEAYNYFNGKVSNTIEFTVESNIFIGDTNLDGQISIGDVTTIQRHLAELAVFNDEQLALADTNGDGRIDISDATHLQMYLAEYNVVLGKT